MPVPWPIIPFADASGLEEWPKRDGVSRSIAKYRSPYAIFPCVPCATVWGRNCGGESGARLVVLYVVNRLTCSHWSVSGRASVSN